VFFQEVEQSEKDGKRRMIFQRPVVFIRETGFNVLNPDRSRRIIALLPCKVMY